MRHIALSCGFLIVLAGCVTTGPTNETGARLPDGVTLLESNEDRCEGVVHIAEGADSSRDIVVRAGENASFRASGDRIEWICIGESSANGESVDCPRETSFVRITRPSGGDEFLLECYG